MITIICAGLAFVLAAVLSWSINENRVLRRELADTTDDRDMQALNAHVAEGRANDALDRAIRAEADADRLAPFVANFITDMDAIAKKLGTIDEKPLDLTDEREAIRLHEEALKLRTK